MCIFDMQRFNHGVDSTEKLYYRIQGDVVCNTDGFHIRRGLVSFFTHFNCFPSYKYKKYTVIDQISIKIRLSGKGKVRIFQSCADGTEILYERHFSCDTVQEMIIDVPLSDSDGAVIYPVVEAEADEGCQLFNFGYYTENAVQREVNLAIVICTYRRENYVLRNLEQFAQGGLDVPVFVIDNGKTLSRDMLTYDKAVLCPNKNYGGSGGFARGMLEVWNCRDDITHMLLMDDDISVECAAIKKTSTFLSFIKEKYADVAVSGAMLILDDPCIQHENGATWEKGCIHSLKQGLDLSKERSIIENETEQCLDYGAWWYMCMPIDVVGKYGLPLPFFIKMDDIEYGIRSLKTIVTLSGVSVWHESFSKKYADYLNYYTTRNKLVTYTLHRKSGLFFALRSLFASVGRCLVTYNYDSLKYIDMAFSDFLKGPDFFKSIDEDELNSRLRSMQEKFLSKDELAQRGFAVNQEITDAYDKCIDSRLSRFIRLITLNGYLIPSPFFQEEYNCVAMGSFNCGSYFRRKVVVQYNKYDSKGRIVYIRRLNLVRGMALCLRYGFALVFRYRGLEKEYKVKEKELTSPEFWRRHLGIGEKE